MVNQKIQDRLAALRAVMKENGVDWYMVPTADFHNSEYVDAYFKVREYLCNFSGSNGTLIVGMDEAGLWTDGRYFIQAERELTGTGVTLYRMLEDNVPTKEEFLQQKMENGQTLGFDGRVVDTRFGLKLEKDLADKQIKIVYGKDLADEVWTDRHFRAIRFWFRTRRCLDRMFPKSWLQFVKIWQLTARPVCF